MEYFSPTKKNAPDLRKSTNPTRIFPKKTLPLQVLDIITYYLYNVQYGTLMVVIQDGVVIKMEVTEKFVVSAKSRDLRLIRVDPPSKPHPLQDKIVTEIQKIMYGQLIIRMDNGQVDQIEKTEKKRAHEIEGLHGDGI